MKITLTLMCLFFFSLGFSQNPVAWEDVTDISSGKGKNHPRISLDAGGNPLVIWGNTTDASVYFTRWTGTRFSTPVKLNPAGMEIATASWMGPAIASRKDTVYVVFKRTPEGADTSGIYIVSSFDGGVSFSKPVKIAHRKGHFSRFPTVTISGSGNPLVGFMEFNTSFMDPEWVVARSYDYGKSFPGDTGAFGYSGTNSEACDCCPGAIVSKGNYTAMLYRNNDDNIREIWTGVSTDDGISFPTGYPVDNLGWKVFSCPASGPDGVIIGDSLYSVFLSAGTGKYRAWLSRSSIKDTKLAFVSMAGKELDGLTQQNYPRIANSGKAVAVVWKQNVYGRSHLPMMLFPDITRVSSRIDIMVDEDNVTNADVAITGDKIFVVWQDDNSGTVKFRQGNYSSVGLKNEADFQPVGIYPNPFSDHFYIESTTEIKEAKISILDLMGKEIISNLNYSPEQPIIPGSLKPGVYLVLISTNDTIYRGRIVKE